MKIRADFVTNSSSSSFIVIKEIRFPDITIGRRKFKDLYFYQRKEENSIQSQHVPAVFSDFVNDQYLRTGSKPTIDKILKSKAQLQKFVDFFNHKFQAQLSIDDAKFFTEEYSSEFGSSQGNDLTKFEEKYISYFHPEIADAIAENKRSLLDSFSGEWLRDFTLYHITEIENNCQKSFIEFHSDTSSTTGFYSLIYNEFKNMIDLNFQAIEPQLRKIGMKKAMTSKLEALGIRIIFAANKTKDNDVVVYLLPESEDVHVLPYSDFVDGVSTGELMCD